MNFNETEFHEWLAAHHGKPAGKFETISGLPLAPLYTPADVDAAALGAEAYPGVAPFTRGIHAGMYRQRLWTVRQYSGFGSAAETNARWKQLLAGGGTGLSTAFDLPTQLGLDPDDPRSRGEVGRVGVPIASVDDMQRLFADIDLASVSVSMTINAPAAVLLAFLQVVAEERGLALEKLRGTVQNDILKEYAARNNFIFPPAPSMALTVDVIEHCQNILTGFYPISVSGYHLREAGCTAAQEIAFTLSNALAYVAAATERGIRAENLGLQLSFFFAAATELLEEVAKFRAARRLWARLLEERFSVRDEKARQLRFHCQTTGSLLTGQQPENNLVRIALQALAAVLGGCQSLHTNSYDEALGLPGENSARLALATQHILACETGITNVADPVGGSFAIEALTDKLEAEARGIIAEVDAAGGALQAVSSGFYQRRIADAAFKYQREVESGERKVVGVNVHTQSAGAESEASIQTLRADMEHEACDSVARVRATRDTAAASAALQALELVGRASLPVSVGRASVPAENNSRLAGTPAPPRSSRMHAILAAARARCTVGEICGVLRKVYGEYRPV